MILPPEDEDTQTYTVIRFTEEALADSEFLRKALWGSRRCRYCQSIEKKRQDETRRKRENRRESWRLLKEVVGYYIRGDDPESLIHRD